MIGRIARSPIAGNDLPSWLGIADALDAGRREGTSHPLLVARVDLTMIAGAEAWLTDADHGTASAR
jgi:hypothetical protein